MLPETQGYRRHRVTGDTANTVAWLKAAAAEDAILRTPRPAESRTFMNEEFRRTLSEFLDAPLNEELSGRALEFKPCFGAVAGYIDGKIFVSCGNFGLALKLPLGPRTELLQRKGGTPLRYFPKGHVKKEYVVIPQRILDDGRTFRGLVRQSVEYVRAAAH